MAEQHELIKERERAHLAKQITDNPLWAEFFAEAEQRLIAQWKTGTTEEFREDVWRYIKLLGQLQKFMEQTLVTGSMAEIALAEMQEKENVSTRRKH